MELDRFKWQLSTGVLVSTLLLCAGQFPFGSVTASASGSPADTVQAAGVGAPSWPAQCPEVIDTQRTSQPITLGFVFDGTGETFTRLSDGASTAATSPSNLVGCYVDFSAINLASANGYHVGTISRDDTGYYWLNAAGIKFKLTLSGETLITSRANPYYSTGHTFTLFPTGINPLTIQSAPAAPTDFTLKYFNARGIAGSAEPTGGPGYYIQAPVVSPIPAANSAGFGWYSSIFPLFEYPVKGSSLGLSSTWITANVPVRDPAIAQKLCATSTSTGLKEATSKPDSGNYGYYLDQSIEGSLGWWLYEKFPTVYPKYQANVTQNCYSSQLATPGWGFFDGAPTTREATGLVQVSNQVLLPPDGMTFQADPSLPQLGTTWLSLPLPTFDHKYKDVAGNNAWTLFLKTANFSGPVQFVAPQFWADGSLTNPVQKGLTLDTLTGSTGQLAAEWGEIPYYEQVGPDGKTYSKIPPVQLPSDSNGQLVFSRDFTAYASNALSTQVANALQNNSNLPASMEAGGVAVVPLSGQSGSVYQHGDDVPYLTKLLKTSALGTGSGFGLSLPTTNSIGTVEQYYVSENGTRSPVPKSSVPTGLANANFAFDGPNTFVYQAPNWWDASPAASETFSAQLNDGSSVDYKWYKFVDQPSLQRFELNLSERNSLQSAAEKIQKDWAHSQLIKDPSAGTLASLDSGLMVTPPKGLEIGYVPIVTKQYYGAPIQAQSPIPTPSATATPRAIPPTPSPSSSRPSTKSISCLKGKVTKKISGVSPKCPGGFKLKK